MKIVTTPERSSLMSKIKGKNTKIEVIFRKALWHAGIRYRKNLRVYNCTPDIVITKHKIAIFCDGDFWHGKNYRESHIKSNSEFWNQKIQRNRERDLETTIMLRDNGWIVLRFWESDINTSLEECVNKTLSAIHNTSI